jgi:hypothetical protein
MTFARLVLAAATNDPVPKSKNPRLPSRQAALAILQYYMDNIYALFPAFSSTTLWATLDNFYNGDQRHIKEPDAWLLFMVLAIGSMAQSQNVTDEFYSNGVDFVSRALPCADRALMPGYITQIQSLVLLTQYSMLDPAHFDSWHLIGFTCRAAVDLGFHQDPPPQHVTDKLALDTRRKMFYCVYALDRSVHIALPLLFLVLTYFSAPLAWSMLEHFPSRMTRSTSLSLAPPALLGFRPFRVPLTVPSQRIPHCSYSNFDAHNRIGTRRSSNPSLPRCQMLSLSSGKCASTCESGPNLFPTRCQPAFASYST